MEQIPSPYGVGRETGSTVPLIVTTWGRERQEGLFFQFLHSKTLLGFIRSFILGSSLSSLSLILGPILWPLLIPCSCLTIYIFPFSGIWEPSLKGKGAMTTLASLGCTGASWGSGFSLPALCQDAFIEGDESPCSDKVPCFSVVWVLVREYSCQTITWRFVVF